MEGYTPVWQTWEVIQPVHTPSPEDVAHTETSKNPDLRQAVQRSRIEKRLSIPALATKIRCDPMTLSAFERGEDILPDDLLKRLLRELNL